MTAALLACSRALVIAPHPDDEVLGVGGTIARLTNAGTQVTVSIVTKGESPPFDADLITRGRAEAADAHRDLGVSKTIFLDLPAARLRETPHSQLNAALQALVRDVNPEVVFVPFRGDLHADHQCVFDSALVALRPGGGSRATEVLAYETLSETNWNAPRGITAAFVPDTFVDITEFLVKKLSAMKRFASQLRPFPNERSIEALEALARHRGATVNVAAAEAFMTIRRIG
jgi:N-acetylglucosamine malate deacetylase 1